MKKEVIFIIYLISKIIIREKYMKGVYFGKKEIK